MADMYFNISMASKKLSRDKDASEYLNKSIEAYKEDLTQEPNSIKTLRNLGNALVEAGRFNEATNYLRQAVDISPSEVSNHLSLAIAFSMQQKYDDAIEVLKKAIVFFSNVRSQSSISAIHSLQERLWYIEDNKKQANNN
jgi:tetratricopeptide (TPR) repeat protein